MDARLVAYLSTLGATPAALDGWTVHTAQRGGVDVAFVITKGSEIHFVSLVGPRAMSRKNIVQYLCPLIEEYGYASTRVPASETNHKLRESLGFICVWQDENYSYWMLMHCPYQRQQPEGTDPCQSQ